MPRLANLKVPPVITEDFLPESIILLIMQQRSRINPQNLRVLVGWPVFLLLANYTWNDIYLADVSVRFDGSSEFGLDQKWAPFWSFGAGVNLHNYAFLNGE